jgi:carotenoid cleavage dioxygenase
MSGLGRLHRREFPATPVPSRSDVGDDEGRLLAFVHDEASGTSELAVLDATDVEAGPVASIASPQRVPDGFHAAWLPD